MNVFFFIWESVGLRYKFGKGRGSVATDAGKLMAMQKQIDELNGQMEAVACAWDRGERVAARPPTGSTDGMPIGDACVVNFVHSLRGQGLPAL